MHHNDNLFAALRAGFPADLDAHGDRDRRRPERAAVLHLARPRPRQRAHRQPARARWTCRRRAHRGAGREVRRGADAVPGRAARRLRLPAAEHRLPGGEIEYFIGNAEPAVVVCAPAQLRLGQPSSRSRPACATSSRSTTTAAAACSSARRCMSDEHAPVARARRRPGGHPLHQRHHRAQQGRDADARQPASQRADAAGRYWGWQPRRRADPRAADLPRARPVRRLHGALLNGSKMLWFDEVRPAAP